MFSTLSWEILIWGKIALCSMFCIIKSNYIVSCRPSSFSINLEKLGDYLKWTDYSQ